MTCPSCSTVNADGARFCVECGTPLAARCPSCSAAYAPGQKFCGECGNPLSAAAAREEAGKCVLLCSNCHAEVEAGVAVPPPLKSVLQRPIPSLG